MRDSCTYPGLKELLQYLQLLLGPGTSILRSDFELQRLVVLGVESNTALQHLRLEHDHPRLIGVHNGQLEQRLKRRGEEEKKEYKLSIIWGKNNQSERDLPITFELYETQ